MCKIVKYILHKVLQGQNTQVVLEYRLTLSFLRKLESSFLYIIDLEIPAFAGMTDLGAFY